VPPAAFGTQRLFRGSYRGPEGEGSFRATLRLAAPDRLQLVLADRLGRTLASLQVDGARQRWTDHRRSVFCAQPAGLTLPGGGDLPLRAEEVPALLLGRLPAPPATALEPPVGGALDYRDTRGRRWTAETAEGSPLRWTLHDAGGPSWWWRRGEERGAVLSQREGRQLRWEEVVVEPLPRLATMEDPPPGFAEDCSAGEAGRSTRG
jgi:hypothetical protein